MFGSSRILVIELSSLVARLCWAVRFPGVSGIAKNSFPSFLHPLFSSTSKNTNGYAPNVSHGVRANHLVPSMRWEAGKHAVRNRQPERFRSHCPTPFSLLQPW
eukprot:scaffold345_cov134-Cylindrotheca_fusiformis.AAC.82